MKIENKVTRLLLQLSAFCTIILIIRVMNTGYKTYFFMLWNLFLAWIPFLVSEYFLVENTKFKFVSKNSSLFYVWLIFLPNAPYIITDLKHLNAPSVQGFWYDLILILSFAITGLLLFLFSVKKVSQKFFSNEKKMKHKLILFSIFILCGYGLYLGRILRFNSWDVFTNPIRLLQNVYYTFNDSVLLKQAILISSLFSLFLYFGYKVFLRIISFNHIKENEPEIFK